MAVYPVLFIVVTVFHLFLLAIPSRLIPDKACRSQPEPASLRSDQMTVVINGYSEHRIPVLQEIAASYSASPLVAAVVLLWCNPSTSREMLTQLTQNISAAVLRAPSSSLNHRFYPWDVIRTRAVLICDDDIAPDPSSVAFAFMVWRSDPDRVIGFFARSHAYDITSRTWIYTMEREKYSIILTKFMIVNRKHLVNYSCDGRYIEARQIVDEMNNCEDILMNFVVAEEIEKGPLMVGVKAGGVRDYGDARNDGISEGLRDVGLSSRGVEHRKRRGQCIREFHRVLGRMPLRYSYGKIVDGVGEQGLCNKGGKIVVCDQQDFG